MNMFIFQTLLLLLAAFLLGLLVGRFLKGLLCRKDHAAVSLEDKMKHQYASYTASADKLAARSTKRDFAASMGAATAATAASAAMGSAVSREEAESGIQSAAETDKSTLRAEDEPDQATSIIIEEPAVALTPLAVEGVAATNLQAIEGIGPAMERILNENGIHDWQTLADTPVESIKSMLGEKYADTVEPASWIEQVNLILEGRLDELVALQSETDGVSKFQRLMNC